MVIVKSKRANTLLENLHYFKTSKSPGMRNYPGEAFDLWVDMERDQQNVKNLSFFGEIEDWQKIVLESMACLMIGKDISKLEQLSLRECEAFLRDRNSELALENIPDTAENTFKKLFTWLRLWPVNKSGETYSFPNEKGPFRNLKLADKVRELKGFLNSPDIIELYQGMLRPELVDVDDLTVFIEVPYQSEKERAVFEELHLLGVEAFQEEKLNFIPEA
ncbi:MAG TPA: hypothetical protein VNJ08_01590 [Bacteriovoracaceae bacterium]|nr:hypothetical protein [Bacteriovoracaceae bacterium]